MVLSYQEDHTAGVVAFGSLYFIGEILGIWKKAVDN
jgi:dihydrofolate synthase/folylpolyglutamate synthase